MFFFFSFFLFFFFFFKQKTAYEIRTGDWSSDVCLPISDSYSDGMTLMAPYLPNKDVAELQYDKFLAGMRDPSKTAGI